MQGIGMGTARCESRLWARRTRRARAAELHITESAVRRFVSRIAERRDGRESGADAYKGGYRAGTGLDLEKPLPLHVLLLPMKIRELVHPLQVTTLPTNSMAKLEQVFWDNGECCCYSVPSHGSGRGGRWWRGGETVTGEVPKLVGAGSAEASTGYPGLDWNSALLLRLTVVLFRARSFRCSQHLRTINSSQRPLPRRRARNRRSRRRRP